MSSIIKVDTIQLADGTAGTIENLGLATGALSHRNLIINGNFDVWQRGTSSTTSNGYGTADRWKQYTAGVGGATFAKNSDGDMHITVTGSGSGTARVGQIVEFPEWYHGKTVTFSAMVKSNNTNARIIIDSNTQWYTETDTHSGGGNWEQLKLTATIESSGLTFLRFTVGLDGAQSANVSLTSSDYVTIKEVQLEIGSVATPFEHRSYGEELARCQRYYYQLGGTHKVIGSAYSPSSSEVAINFYFPVTMRTTPTISVSNITNFEFRKNNNTAYTFSGSGGVNVTYMTPEGGSYWRNGEGLGASGWAGEVRTRNATTGYIYFDAEI